MSIFDSVRNWLRLRAARDPIRPNYKLPAITSVEDALDVGNGRLGRPKRGDFELYQQDLAEALLEADDGKLARAARAWRYVQSDATLSGVLGTRSAGLVALPREFHGDQDFGDWLARGYAGDPAGDQDPRSTFDLIMPPSELRKLEEDGVGLGYGVGCLTEIDGSDLLVFSRLDPECVSYRPYDNTWLFESITGPIEITPGDGFWVLHLPGGRTEPWRAGIWNAVAQAAVRKQHSQLMLDSWLRRYSHPARQMAAVHRSSVAGSRPSMSRRAFGSVPE